MLKKNGELYIIDYIIKHIKEVSKKKVTFAKIEQFTKKNKIEISTEELNRIIENWLIMVLYRCKVKIKMQHIIFPNNLKVMCVPRAGTFIQ